MIKCPKCNHKSKVTETRSEVRVRMCLKCAHRWKTVEVIPDTRNYVKVPADEYDAFVEFKNAVVRNTKLRSWGKR